MKICTKTWRPRGTLDRPFEPDVLRYFAAAKKKFWGYMKNSKCAG